MKLYGKDEKKKEVVIQSGTKEELEILKNKIEQLPKPLSRYTDLRIGK